MPIHDLGYRAWQGSLTSEAWRWWVIAQTGVRLAWRGVWLKRLLYVVWLPTLYTGVAFFFYEQFLTHTAELDTVVAGARQRVVEETLAVATAESPQQALAGAQEAIDREAPVLAEAALAAAAQKSARRTAEGFFPSLQVSADRHQTWAWLLRTFFRWPQGLLMLTVVGLIAPPLIARDVRSRAFLLYFSRPITRVEYILGKMAVVLCYVLMITTAPALVLYGVGVLLSPEWSVLAATWDLPLRILAVSAVLTIPTTALALACSSLTTKTWHATFAWFAVWVFGLVAYGIFWGYIEDFNPDGRWTPLSLYLALGEVQSWIFGIAPALGRAATFAEVWPSAMSLVVLTVVSVVIVFRRVSSPMRV